MKYSCHLTMSSKLLAVTLLVLSCGLWPEKAHAEWTANAAIATDYVFRGISNSNRRPALQGGIDYSNPSGIYAGSWASSVDFSDGGEAKVELDGYIGHAGRAGKSSWNVGWMAYVYPGARSSLQYDTSRISAGLQYDFSSVIVGLYYDRIDNVFGSGPGHYLETSFITPLREDVSLDLRLGRQRYSDNATLTMPDFTYRSLAVVWQAALWEARLAWQDNGVQAQDCFAGKSWCGQALMLQFTRRISLSTAK